MRDGLQALLQPRRGEIEKGAQFQRLLLVRGMDQMHRHWRRRVIREKRLYIFGYGARSASAWRSSIPSGSPRS